MENDQTKLTDQQRMIREKGRKFLDELKAKGPRSKNLGKVYAVVLRKNVQSEKPIADQLFREATDEPLSLARKFKKCRLEL